MDTSTQRLTRMSPMAREEEKFNMFLSSAETKSINNTYKIIIHC